MTDSSHRRASSPLLNSCLPPPILEDEEEEEELCETNKSAPPNSLLLPNNAGSASRDLYSPQLLCVDESKRPRAHSDPSVQVGGFANYILPEITVTEDDGGGDSGHAHGTTKGGSHMYLMQPLEASRKRSNTCPEDLFRPSRKGRPATPPPTDVVPVLAGKRRTHSAGGVRRLSFNFAPPPVALKSPTSVSFAHHKLSKVNEDLISDPANQTNVSSTSGKRTSESLTRETLRGTQSGKIDNLTKRNSSVCDTVTNSPNRSSKVNTNSQHEAEKNSSDRLFNNDSSSTISLSTPINRSIPSTVSSNGIFPNRKHTQDSFSSQPRLPHTSATAALISEPFRTLSVTDKKSCESKAHGSASELLKDSPSSWRAGEETDKGHLTTV